MTTATCTWSAVKRPSGKSYDVQTENGIRVTAWPVAKQCHARVLACMMNGTPDGHGSAHPIDHRLILRALAITRAFYRWEASDSSRNFPAAVHSWNDYATRTEVWSRDGKLEATDATATMEGWERLAGILPTIEGGDR